MVAAIILACAAHVAMIVVGRVLQGVAVSMLPHAAGLQSRAV